MNLRKSTLACSLLIAAFLFVSPAVHAQPPLQFFTIDFPGATSTGAGGVNALGQIVGAYSSPSSPCTTTAHGAHLCGSGYLLSMGHFSTINGPPGGTSMVFFMRGINLAGDIVGTCCPFFFGIATGFLFSHGSYTVISDSNACDGATDAHQINDVGQIVGAFEECSGAVHGYVLLSGIGGPFTTIDYPGASGTLAFGINNLGQIVGAWNDPSNHTHGFSDIAGTFTTVDFPGSTLTEAQAINDNGEIVGYYNDGSGVAHGFLDVAGVFTSFDVPGATLTQASGISNNGEIVGGYIDASLVNHGFSTVSPFPLHPTSTVVQCVPSSIPVSSPTNCTATVTDSSPIGATTPTGPVSFSSSSSGTFTPPNPCMLVSTGPSTSNCSVSYTPSPGSEGTHVITGTYSGDLTHSGSSNMFHLTVTKRTTMTSVSCAVAFLTDHHATPCTATVTDTSPGAKITPSGTVGWRSSGKGTFSPVPGNTNPCTLSGVPGSGTATCTVTYTASPGKPLPQTITGTYSGDTDHSGSSNTTPITTP